MAKVKVINNNLDPNINGNYFQNTPSQTIFSFGSFNVTSNFDGRTYIDYSNTLSSFVRAVTLDTLGITSSGETNIINDYTTNAVLNLDKSNLNSFIRFGSGYEYLRVSIENIILNYPYSLFLNSQVSINGNTTFFDYYYDIATNTSSFKIPINAIVNDYGFVFNYNNTTKPDDNELRNLNLSYDKYIIWSDYDEYNNTYQIIGYTGNTSGRNYLMIQAKGNALGVLNMTSGKIDFHIKPNNYYFEKFRSELDDYQKYILSTRKLKLGFEFVVREPVLLDNGNVIYSNTLLLWGTPDGYNIDIKSPAYKRFLERLLTIGNTYDKIKTDLIARFLTPSSLKAYDLTDEGKMTKLLRIYGREFDQLREFIDSLVYINRITYDKINNIPDQLIKNLSKTFGWDYFSLVNEEELVNSFLTIDENERNLKTDLMPAEIDIELWRRILINTNYFWKSKGTRESIKAMFLLIGIPEPFINISEYVYTVEGKIDPRSVTLNINSFGNSAYPFDSDGYPAAPPESNSFYFQISGTTDSGQAYMNNFRKAGFNLIKTVDNKKSWTQTGATFRIDDTTPIYYQEDSKLVINTKEIDVSLDTARGIEYDVYEYIKKDFAINSSGYTLPYSYVNISLDVVGNQNTFPLPPIYGSDKVLGDLEVRFNGILLNGTSVDNSYGDISMADYTIDYNTKTFTLLNSMYAQNNASRRDVVQATFIYSGGSHSMSGLSVQYIVTRVNANPNGTVIPIPSYPRGDVQVTINGVALTPSTPQYVADYILDLNNTGNTFILIQNPDVITYLRTNPMVQIAYVEVVGSDSIFARSEILRVHTFNGSKLYYNQSANRYVYKMNYKTNNTSDIKILVDGIALEPNTDYTINVLNPYEIFLPKILKYGSVISVYYLVGGNAIFHPVINDVFGVGDISKLSFLEFIELIQRKLINAKNRKTITDFKGGWYPSLLRVYVEYLKRSNLQSNDPLLSNGYTFQNLYSFLSKYNAFFDRFIEQLLSATIILRRKGLVIRNTVFTKQKFMYRRGVNLYSKHSKQYDIRGNYMLKYLGDDGGRFMINQSLTPPLPELYVETIPGNLVVLPNGDKIITTGGMNIIGYDTLTRHGMLYRVFNPHGSGWSPWVGELYGGSLLTDTYPQNIYNIIPDTLYEYRSFVESGNWQYSGNTLQMIIAAEYSIHTKDGTPTVYSIMTGGYDIIGNDNVEYYGMRYRKKP